MNALPYQYRKESIYKSSIFLTNREDKTLNNLKYISPDYLLSPSINLAASEIPYESYEVAEEHNSYPLKEKEDINDVIFYFLDKHQFRNAMFFVCGINLGLRISDLRMLRFGDFIEPSSTGYTFKDELILLEKKTKNTRKQRMNRHLYINAAIRQIIALYLQYNEKTLNEYMFINESRNNKYGNYVTEQQLTNPDVEADEKGNYPVTRQAAEAVIKRVIKILNIDGRFATHMLRKTFSYHMLNLLSKGKGYEEYSNERGLLMLQQMIGHDKPSTTLRYAGFTQTEERNAYMELNLGLEAIMQWRNRYSMVKE